MFKRLLLIALCWAVAVPAAADSPVIYSGNGYARNLTSKGFQLTSGNTLNNDGAVNYAVGKASKWTASGSVTVADDTTTNARTFTSNTGVKFTATGAGNAYFCFGLDSADYNKKLAVSFDQAPAAGYVGNDFQIDIYSTASSTCASGLTRLALSTDSSAISGLPNLTGTFRTTFDSPGSGYVKVQVTQAANSHAITLSNFYVGPGIVTQGAAVTQWQTSTMVLGGSTTAPTKATSPSVDTFYWRRVGDSIQMRYTYAQGSSTGAAAGSGTYYFTLPNLLTVNTAAILETGSTQQALGVAYAYNGTNEYTGFVQAQTSTQVAINLFTTISATAPLGSANVSLGNANARISFEATVPVNEWAGAGTVNVVQNDCEYAYNNGNVTGAGLTDSSSFAYGPAGTSFLSYNSATTSASWTAFQVQWKTPISVTDKNGLEINDGSDWIDSATILPWIAQGTSRYGMRLESVDSKTLQVDFGNAGALPTNAGYAGAGTAWSVLSTYKWRVKKCAGGQAVGFGAANTTAAGLVSYEDSGTFSVTFTGPRTITADTWRYARVGKVVTIEWPANIGASCSAANFAGAAQLPSALRPAITINGLLFVQDNGTTQTTPGDLSLLTTGEIDIGKAAAGSFTNAANCGYYAGSWTYPIN